MSACGSLPASLRNPMGFAVGASSACSSPAPRAPSSLPGSVTQAVDSLLVRDQLLTNRQFGAQLTLTGTGTSTPAAEAALVVKTSAVVEGISTHGALVVSGAACMQGTLTAPSVVGPMTISAPATAGSSVPSPESLLTVEGIAVAESLFAAEVNAASTATDLLNALEAKVNLLNATTGVFETLNADVLLQNGVPSGSLAPAEIAALFAGALVAIVAGGVARTGIAVSPTSFLTSSASGLETLATAVSVVFPQYLGSSVAAPGTVTNTMLAGNLALITLTAPVTVLAPVFVAAALEGTDSPVPGTPLLMGTVDAVGQFGFVPVTVQNAHAQMFEEYTSVHVNGTTTPLDNPGVGAPLIDYSGRLVALVQYGTASTATFFGDPLYGSMVGGIKGRFIDYFLQQSALPVTSVALPVLSGSSFGRPIQVLERATASGLLPGGVAVTAATSTPVTSSTQALRVFTTAPPAAGGPILLGNAGPNNPAMPEALLALAVNQNATQVGLLYTNASPDTPVTETSTSTTTSYWSSGLPVPSGETPGVPACDSLSPAQTQVSTNMTLLRDTPAAGYFTSVDLQCLNWGPGDPSSSASFAVSTHGNALDTDTHSFFVLAWGSLEGISLWIEGLGGNTAVVTIKEAWQTFVSVTRPTYLVAYGGNVAGTYTFYQYTPSSSAVGFDVSIDNSVLGELTVILDAQPSTTQTFLCPSQTYNIYDFITDTCYRGFSASSTGNAFTFSTGVPSTVTLDASVIAATAMY